MTRPVIINKPTCPDCGGAIRHVEKVTKVSEIEDLLDRPTVNVVLGEVIDECPDDEFTLECEDCERVWLRGQLFEHAAKAD